MTSLRLIAEIVFGVLYAAGAIFNLAYTLGHAGKFYGAFLEGAWHGPARWLLRTLVLPNAVAFTVVLVLFELALAIAILTRSDLAGAALVAGAVFCLAAAAVSSPGGTAANLLMAAVQALLASYH